MIINHADLYVYAAPPAPPSSRAPPPPAPPAGASSLPQPEGARVDLLASIRTAGVAKLRHVDESATPSASTPRAETPSTPAADGGNLASALAAALTVRRAGTGDSDDEDDSDDEWDE